MEHELIYDIGVNDGVDSAYYLTLARRVIGVEASPKACEALRRRFAAEIAEGRYLLLNIGIAEQAGELEFWTCESNPEWCSFDRELASRGTGIASQMVPTRTFAQVVAEYGAPDFVKIDIEGYDKICLASLSPEQAPPYISVELGHGDGDGLISELKRLGYQDFKIVGQTSMSPAVPFLNFLGYVFPPGPKWWLRHLDKKFRGVTEDRGWKFSFGSSGAFGERAAGKWRSAGHALRVWRQLFNINNRLGRRGNVDWFDIHARLPS